jgi:hypothetical protein
MANDDIPEGYYRGKNGRLYPAKRESLLDRTARERAEREAQAAIDAIADLDEQSYPITPNRNRIGYWPSTFEVIEAPTSDKSHLKDQRDRAEQCGFHHPSETLVIVFRMPVKKNKVTGYYEPTGAPPPVYRYDDFPEEMWEQLKMSDSTGKFLKYNGVDNYNPRQTNFAQLSAEFK